MTATSPVLKQIAGLPKLSQDELKVLWREYFGSSRRPTAVVSWSAVSRKCVGRSRPPSWSPGLSPRCTARTARLRTLSSKNPR